MRDRNRNCILCQFNKISGFQGICPGKNLEFDPTLTVQRNDARDWTFPAGDLEAGKVKVEPGLTARWGVTPNLILNATVNPDFSQVEADVAQLDVNTRFALYYPEKRPFFLEGADFFLTPFETVFTRTRGRPALGRQDDRQDRPQRRGLLRHPGPHQQPALPLQPGYRHGLPGRRRLRRRLPLPPRHRRNSTVGFLYTGRAGGDMPTMSAASTASCA